MGFIRILASAAGDAIRSSFGDQWLDFLVPPTPLSDTAVVFPAVVQRTNAGRGENVRASENIISNGSTIVVPEGYGLLTFQDGAVTGFINEPGTYRYDNQDQNAKSVFSGGGILSATFATSWQRFKFGGQPGTQQLAFYVNLKEIPNNLFGTQGPIYWDDSYLGAQAGAITRGSYVLRVVDPILFIKTVVPVSYISPNAPILDLTQVENPVSSQLFNEVVGSLAGALSRYVNSPDREARITRIQSDSVGFAQSLSAEIESNYHWTEQRGLTVASATIISIEYDADTTALLSDVRRADALGGSRGDAFLKQSVARGVESAGETGGGTGLAMMGMGMGAMGNLVGASGSAPAASAPSAAPAAAAPATAAAPAEAAATADPAAQLAQYKKMLDDGLINDQDYEALKKKALGI